MQWQWFCSSVDTRTTTHGTKPQHVCTTCLAVRDGLTTTEKLLLWTTPTRSSANWRTLRWERNLSTLTSLWVAINCSASITTEQLLVWQALWGVWDHTERRRQSGPSFVWQMEWGSLLWASPYCQVHMEARSVPLPCWPSWCLSFFCLSLVISFRFHAWWLWPLLWVHSVCYGAQWDRPRAGPPVRSYWHSLQKWSKVSHLLPHLTWMAYWLSFSSGSVGNWKREMSQRQRVRNTVWNRCRERAANRGKRRKSNIHPGGSCKWTHPLLLVWSACVSQM